MTREEVMRASGLTSGSKSTVKIGATKDGKIVAAQGTFYLQAGAFPGAPIRGAAGCAFVHFMTSPTSIRSASRSSPTAQRCSPIVRPAHRSAHSPSSRRLDELGASNSRWTRLSYG